jgi:hypothetical protein
MAPGHGTASPEVVGVCSSVMRERQLQLDLHCVRKVRVSAFRHNHSAQFRHSGPP